MPLAYSRLGSSVKDVWSRTWIMGTPKKRRAVKCCCFLFFALFIAIIIVVSVALYFSATCRKLSSYSETLVYNNVGRTVQVQNNFPRGTTKVGGVSKGCTYCRTAAAVKGCT